MKKSLSGFLKDIMLFQSYPMCWIDDSVNDDIEKITTLYEAVRLLHKIESFNGVIDDDDFFKVKLYLTECLHDLMHMNNDEWVNLKIKTTEMENENI